MDSAFPPSDLPRVNEGMRLRVRHLTRYHYDSPLLDSYNDAKLCPVSDHLQQCESFHLRLNPAVAVQIHKDGFLNRVDHFQIHVPHQFLEVEAVSLVQTRSDERGPVPECQAVESLHDPDVQENYYEFVTESKYVTQNLAIHNQAKDIVGRRVTDLWQDALKVGRFVHATFAYDPDWTHVHTNAAEALKDRRGVCQDYAHVMIAYCRSLGIPARYVSGYFFNGKTGDENEASHAWTEIFIPGYGWKAWDPTHNREADARYIKLAIGRDYDDAKPVSGRFRGHDSHRLEVVVQIREVG